MRLSTDIEKLHVFLRADGPRIRRFMLCVFRSPEEPGKMTSGTLPFSLHAYSRFDSGYTLKVQSAAFLVFS